MRILFVSEYYYPVGMGGAEISMKILAEELAKRHDVHILTPNYREHKDSEAVENKVTVHRFKSGRIHLFRRRNVSKAFYKTSKNVFSSLLKLYARYSSHELKKWIEKTAKGFDVIHANNFESVVAINDAVVRGKKIAHLRDFRLAGVKLENIDFFVAISKFVKNEYVKCGMKKTRMGVVYNPVSPEDVSRISKACARKRLGLNFKRIALFVGSLVAEKGVEEIPEIAAALPEYDFVIAGDGPEKDFLMKNKAGNMHMAGFVSKSELKHYYRAADILIVPSEAEPFGRVVIEGQANGCVVIGRNKGALKELIKSGKTGFLASSPEGFVKTVNMLDKSKMGAVARNSVEAVKKYSSARIAEKIEKLYGRLRYE